jgi:hypothetical protein
MRQYNHNDEVKEMRLEGHIARMGGKRYACRIFIRKPGEKRQSGNPRYRTEDIKIVLTDIRYNGVDEINLAQDKEQ